MKIKGHSTIELTNVKTGEVERYEDDNMVTNALDLYCADLGMLGVSPLLYNEVRNDLINTLMGGLLLMGSQITENANTVTCPGGNKMIGNGSYNVTADGQDGVTELGSWNATESGWASDGSYKMVWDFATTQANGTINCVCLTSANHGYIGEGNSTSNAGKSTKRGELELAGTPQEYNLDANADVIRRILKVTYADSTATFVDNYNYNYNATYAAEHMSQTGKLKVITKEIPMSQLDMRMSYPMGNTDGQSYIEDVVTDITLPSAFISQLGTNTPWLGGKHGNYYYMLAANLDNLAVGASVQGVKIDLSTLTATGFTVTNTLSASLYLPYGEGGVMFGSGKVAVVCWYGDPATKGVMFQDISNNADTTFVEDTTIFETSGRYFKRCMREESAIFCYRKIDFTDCSVTMTNGSEEGTVGIRPMVDNPLFEDYIPYDNGYWRPSTFRLYHTTDYLATINNLQAAVTKTAEKTMKVTYVIRFSDGE